MADPRGFLKYTRELPPTRDVSERVQDYKDLYQNFPTEKTIQQAARCMDCGVPFCHSKCPLGNIIPEFNDAVYQENWREAYEILSLTNNFPEFTGRICPAPCEAACVLGINQPPVTIEHIEKSIIETAFSEGYVKPRIPEKRSGYKVAVIGSGPAGLAAAAQLNQAGHEVVVLERDDQIGGLLRYGIPDFKLEKHIIDRRLALMEAEGICFQTNAHVGVNVAVADLLAEYDALVLCGGSTIPRNLDIPGRELSGIHFAMEYLEQSNRRVAGLDISQKALIDAKGKQVVVIGGGDTGADCVGTAHRQGAVSVTQLEIMPQPPKTRDPLNWPNWPMIQRDSTSHEEGGQREWAILSKAFTGDEQGRVKALHTQRVNWDKDPTTGRFGLQEIENTEQELATELVLIAAGFLHPEPTGMIAQLGLELDERGNVKTEAGGYQTSHPQVFAAGDMRRGQSLVVWAMSEGREAAREVDCFLMGNSQLSQKNLSAMELVKR